MDDWQRLGFESEGDYNRDRFYDEVELNPPEPLVCGDCDQWVQCTLKGHEKVGWCLVWKDFYEQDDERCE